MAVLKISDEAKRKIEAMRKREIRKQEQYVLKLLYGLGFELNDGAKLKKQLQAAKDAAPELFVKEEKNSTTSTKINNEDKPESSFTERY